MTLTTTTLDFSSLYRASSQVVAVSPSNTLLATAVGSRLVVRHFLSLQIASLFNCSAAIDFLQFSFDSGFVFAASKGAKTSAVFSIDDKDWKCEISEGVAGLKKVLWAPRGRHLLVFSEFNLRITVWSLIDKEAVYIQYPKHENKGYAFRSDSRYFACAEQRKGAKDYVAIYDCDNWSLVKDFPVDTSDLEDLAWSPDGRFIAVWDSVLEYKMLIYSPDGRQVASYTTGEPGLGIKSVCWSPSGQFLAIGSFDEKLRLISNMTWKPLIELTHPSLLPFPDIEVYKESNQRDLKDVTSRLKARSLASDARPHIHYELIKPPFTVPTVKVEIDKLSPKKGVGMCAFNCDGSYIASRNDNMPNSLWIFHLPTLSQSALIHQMSPIKQFLWNPLLPAICAISCANGYIYMWSESEGCSAIEVPAVNFDIVKIEWSPDGKALVVMDKDKFCVAYLVEA
ncbi:WD repeat-containing protein wrap73 [Podochytrium sp. JEL0797]|nr:WD repeat-containing protein wrap73 [Podochytrium sp. JEL0797]